jgi:2-oxoisovalerate dehydrogenase E1 component alpha subunit
MIGLLGAEGAAGTAGTPGATGTAGGGAEGAEAAGYRCDLTDEAQRDLYRDMVLARRVDTEATALQRQGELALWVSSAGQEAAQVGSVRALRDTDTVFPSYREHAVALARGVTPLELASLFRGRDFGGWDVQATRLRQYSLVLATQTLHAVGYALGIRMEQRRALAGSGGPDEAVIVYLGDGATSEGDASEALSWAAVDRLPIVFFCQNNQWAISTPVARQTAVPLHRRAEGFGLAGVHVDGNDVLAVHAVTAAAMDRARSGGGPTFIEATTYRLGGHSTADDPGRYRAGAEVQQWRERDPIPRLAAHLAAAGLLDDAFVAEVEATAAEVAGRLRLAVPRLPDPPPAAIHRDVYSDSPR